MRILITSCLLVSTIAVGLPFIGSVWFGHLPAILSTLIIIIILIGLCGLIPDETNRESYELSLVTAAITFLVYLGIETAVFFRQSLEPLYIVPMAVALLLLLGLIYLLRVSYIDDLSGIIDLAEQGTESIMGIQMAIIFFFLFYLPF